MVTEGDDASFDEQANAQEEQEQQEDPQQQDEDIRGINDLLVQFYQIVLA